jgi:hypothetical protein
MKIKTNAHQTVAALKNIPTQQELKKYLEQHVITVDFRKLSGESRTMTCTLREDMKPPSTKSDTSGGNTDKDSGDAVICVWDVIAQGWRSFRYDRVSSVRVVEEYQSQWYRKKD